jgi:hypothetical protein
MRTLICSLTLVAAVALCASPVLAQEPPARTLQLSFDADGRVNLAARDVTVREILAEWARQCGCYVLNAERLPGGPLATPIQFEHASQQAVLESLLRSAAGYALTPKRAGSRGVSNFETIYIVAVSSPVSAAYTPPPVAPAPMMAMPTPGSPDDEIPPVVLQGPQGPQGLPQSLPPGMPAPAMAPPGYPAPTSPTSMPTPSSTQTPRISGTPTSFVPGASGGTPQSSAPAPGTVTPVPTPAVPPQGR